MFISKSSILRYEIFLFRAQFGEGSSVNTVVSSIKLDTVSTRGSEVAAFVEQCRCPPGYTGLSCEQCAPEYERDQASTSLFHTFLVLLH